MSLIEAPESASEMDNLPDEKMEQVRELLFGGFQRQMASRSEQLEARMRELEARLAKRLDAMDAKIEALAGEVDATQRTTLDEIARGMQSLSDKIRGISRS